MGKLVFPECYPYKPPSVYMLTPSGRFKSNTKLCLSMSDFHPETWNPMWSVSSVLTGLLSFMLGNEDTVGSMHSSDAEKRKLAVSSHDWNAKDKVFRVLFPELVSSSSAVAGNSRLPSGANKAALSDGVESTVQGDRMLAQTSGESQPESLLSLLGWLAVLFSVLAMSWKLMQYLGALS